METLALLFGLASVLALGAAGYAIAAERRRRAVLERAKAEPEWAPPARLALLDARSPQRRWLRAAVDRWIPQAMLDELRANDKLVRAGFTSSMAPIVFAALQMLAFVAFPVLALALAGEGFRNTVVALILGAIAAWVVPAGVLARLTRQRQQRIRKALPDALDLLLICVEAGGSLDSAMLRVATELQAVHPELADELLIVLRKVNRGMLREQALRELCRRTGVEELRTLVANIIQTERWGTSMGRVLRVAASTMRRKRRQAAEKLAHTAALKMTMPLVLLILPALFIVVMGPVALSILATFGGR